MVVTAIVLAVALLASVRPLGAYIDDVFAGRPTLFSRALRPLETTIHRVCRIDATREMTWRTYAFALIALSCVSVAAVYLGLRVQAALPLDPQGFGNVAPDLAWNTAISFATTTDW